MSEYAICTNIAFYYENKIRDDVWKWIKRSVYFLPLVQQKIKAKIYLPFFSMVFSSCHFFSLYFWTITNFHLKKIWKKYEPDDVSTRTLYTYKKLLSQTTHLIYRKKKRDYRSVFYSNTIYTREINFISLPPTLKFYDVSHFGFGCNYSWANQKLSFFSKVYHKRSEVVKNVERQNWR